MRLFRPQRPGHERQLGLQRMWRRSIPAARPTIHQFFNAAACPKVGAGIALPPDAHTAEAVSDAVGRLLAEAAYRDAARRVSGEIAAMPSPTEVADKLHAAYG
jgi:UDP:flavonoid glycosyltransferase YjiC (YdhE family)